MTFYTPDVSRTPLNYYLFLLGCVHVLEKLKHLNVKNRQNCHRINKILKTINIIFNKGRFLNTLESLKIKYTK